jgi:Domain of unknown function (DUF5655)
MTPESPSVDDHFAGRPPALRQIYDRLLAAAATFGPVAEDPKKTSIHLNRKTAFAGVATRKASLILTLKAERDIRSLRVSKHERASANRWHLEVRLADPTEIDAELIGWLQEAYELSG